MTIFADFTPHNHCDDHFIFKKWLADENMISINYSGTAVEDSPYCKPSRRCKQCTEQLDDAVMQFLYKSILIVVRST